MRLKLIAVAAFLLGAAISSAQPAPSPTVSKTVGTTPGCAATNSIGVVPGATVYYCYQIVNPFNATLTYSLLDDKLGLIDNSSISALGTGQDIANAVINGTVTNIATWFWSVSPTNGTRLSGNLTASATVGILAPVSVPTVSDLGLVALGFGILAVSLRFLQRGS